MRQILENWDGKYVLNDEVVMNLDDLKVKDGDEFHVVLLSKRREVRDEKDILST